MDAWDIGMYNIVLLSHKTKGDVFLNGGYFHCLPNCRPKVSIGNSDSQNSYK